MNDPGFKRGEEDRRGDSSGNSSNGEEPQLGEIGYGTG